MMSWDADIVIIGAGLAGASTAFHLSQERCGSVIILEQEAQAGAHSSGRNAAIVREHADTPDCRHVLRGGAQVLRTGELARFDRRGLMILGAGDRQAGDVFPRACGAGRWFPQDVTVDVAGLLSAYLDAQEVRYNTRVFDWQVLPGGLQVRTDHGDIRCRKLVNAAGPWAGHLGGLPLTPLNRHLFVSTPLDWVDRGWPCIWDGTRGLYFRPESGGLLLSCCDEVAAEPGDYREDPAMTEELAEKLARYQPELAGLSIGSQWVGQRVFAPDRRFVIGPDPRNERLFHVAGLGGHGVTGSYVIGQLAARLISGHNVPEARDFDPARLAGSFSEEHGVKSI